MSKQSFTTGQVLTAAQVNSLQANDFNQTVSVKTANYTLAAADKGTRIEFNTSGSVTCTVNSGLFDAGDTLVIQNRGAGTATITAGTATVNTSASLALAQYSAGTLYFVSDSAALFFGDAAGISASIIDAKGDLIVGTADNTVGRLAVGTDGHTLVADSSVSPTGLKWAAPAAGSFVGCYVYRGSTQSIANNTTTSLVFEDEIFDTDGFHSNVTNASRITIPSGKGGKYLIIGQAAMNIPGSGAYVFLQLRKNGSTVEAVDAQDALTVEENNPSINKILDLAATDYVELRFYQNTGTSKSITSGEAYTFFQVQYLGA